jgi:lysyl-tRNA synthetase class 2
LTFYKSSLWQRARIIQAIREFFIDRDYLEVETPILIPSPAPEVHIDAIRTSRGFLHTSPELCMKRLLSCGYSSIFQICKCFREGERGDIHLPEFTLLEWYKSDAEYMDLMEECEELIRFVVREQGMGDKIKYLDMEIDLKRPWERITVKEAFERYSSLALDECLQTGRFDETIVKEIEPKFDKSRPVFLYDYPSSLAALSSLKESNPALAERFELYIGGFELANAFTELNDADEQARRFVKEEEERREMGKVKYSFPNKFIEDLKQMPASAGIAFGIDRLVMLLTNSEKIDEVVSFTPEGL